ncbi:MAG: transglycosylase SLT domain-containing protein [Candidatus Xenobia bacterium]
MQSLIQEIMQLTQELQQEIASGQDPTSTEDQLQSDEQQLNDLLSQMGGSGGGGSSAPISGSGGGGAPAASGVPSGGSVPSTGGSNPATAGSSGSPSSGTTYDGGSGGASQQTVQQNAQIVAQVAKSKGVDPVTAVATMLVESGGNNQSVGDGGTSFGLFQLHQGGELPAGWSQQQAFNPQANAEVALSQFAALNGKYSDPGQLAAAAQRPADPAGYARQVDSKLAEARQLLGMG